MFVLCKTKGCRNAGLKGERAEGNVCTMHMQELLLGVGGCEKLHGEEPTQLWVWGGCSAWEELVGNRAAASSLLLCPLWSPQGQRVPSALGLPCSALALRRSCESEAGKWDFAPVWDQSAPCPHGTSLAEW